MANGLRRWPHVAIAMLLAFIALRAAAQVASPHAIDIPKWFSEGFLDFREETAAADRSGKRLLVYFGQDGCPYCSELMQTNFSQRAIVEKTRRHFVAIALNIWGDREVTWIDGRTMSEKEFARFLKVQFTPTLLFLDGRGRIVARLNGYYPPNRFSAALDYVAARLEDKQPLGDYLDAKVKEAASASLNEQPFLLKPPYDLRRRSGGKPLAVIFETRHCQPCDEMHREGFRRAEVQAQLGRFDVARFALSDRRELVVPDGRTLGAQAWARELNVAYTPTIVFFDDTNKEVFRIDGYLRPFHLASSFEYVAGAGYRSEPEFQRYLRAKAERLREAGRPVELWR
jgi:thioredoxin-related protein